MTEVVSQSGANIYEKPEDAQSSQAFVNRWLEAIKLAEEEEKDWRKTAKEAQSVYCSDDAMQIGTVFNLYHANIETTVPALYNSTPVPDIRRRYGDDDDAAKQGADAIERCLTALVDEYDFDEVLERTVHHFALAGRGVARIVYDPVLADDDGVEDVAAQFLSCRVVPWEGFRRGPARAWEDVPWIAFEHFMTRKALEKLDPVHGAKVPLEMTERGEGTDVESDIFKKTRVWEIWDKNTREVYFIAPSYQARYVSKLDDPLRLKGFWPIPRPMQVNRGDDTMVPLCTYQVQKPILDELDTIARRIKRLVSQLRPRALGPGKVDMDALAKADDGEIVEVSDIMAFLDNGGMDKMLAWFPMEPNVSAIKALYEHRQIVKQDLFEVSGLADVMRGQSDSSETLGAQQMKTQWGSLRIQRHQQEVQRFARDLFRLMAEIVAEHYTPENIAMMTGIQLDDPALAVITNDRMRSYRIDIETDSTIRGDLTRNMTQMTQFMQGTAQFLQAMAPAVQVGIPMDVMITIYSSFARNFKLGKEVDAVLDNLPEIMKQQQAQASQQPSPEQVKAEAEAKKVQMDLEATKAKTDMQMAQGQQQLQLKQAEGQMTLQMKQAEMEMKREEMALNREATMQDHQLKQQTMVADHQMQQEASQINHRMGIQQTMEKAKASAEAAKMKPKPQGRD